jgi:hypothetical protein
MNAHVPVNENPATKKWLLARARTVRAGVMLIVAQIDELGTSLASDAITTEQAACDLEVLEMLPVYYAAHIFTPVDDTPSPTIQAWDAAFEAQRPKQAKPTKPKHETPQATIDAFWHVVRQNDQAQLARWLDDHPLDRGFLESLWRAKCQES